MKPTSPAIAARVSLIDGIPQITDITVGEKISEGEFHPLLMNRKLWRCI